MNASQQDALQINVTLDSGYEVIPLEFTGRMALSALYEFEIDVLCKEWIDDSTVFSKKAQLAWSMGALTRQVCGIIDDWQVIDNNLGLSQYYRYRFHLVPLVSPLQYTVNIATYLNESIPDIISQILRRNHIEFRMDLHQNYSKVPFVCQYQESDWHFISRWLERLGMFYYFDHQQQKEILVITDANGTLRPDHLVEQLIYQPDAKQPLSQHQARLWSWSYHKKRCPQKIRIVAYDPLKASQVISAEATVDPHSQGTVTAWQESLLSDTEVKAYAQTLATVYQCQAQLFEGSVVLGLMPGAYVNIDHTYHSAWNQKNYLVVQAEYQASQQQAVLANVFQVGHTDAAQAISDCRFTAIPLSQPFKAAFNTPMPKIQGVVPAFIIDSTNSGIKIPINQDGCYQVAFSSEANAKTFWVRMSQMYAGDSFGAMYPLHAGTEVLLSFMYGNPDLPVITGAMFNSTHKEIFNQHNNYQSGIISANRNSIIFTDQTNGNNIVLSSPDGSSSIAIGSTNGLAPPTPTITSAVATPVSDSTTQADSTTTTSSSASSSGVSQWTCGNSYTYTRGDSVRVTEGASSNTTLGATQNLCLGGSCSATVGLGVGATMGISLSFSAAGSFKKDLINISHTAPTVVQEATASITQTVGATVLELLPVEANLTSTTMISLESAAVALEATTVTIEAGAVTVTVSDAGVSIASATMPVSIAASVLTITADDINITGDVNVEGALTLTGDQTLLGDMTITGDIEQTGMLTIAGTSIFE